MLVRGTALQLTGPEETARVDELPLQPWVGTPEPEYVEIAPTKVTGRRFHLGH